MAKSGFGSCVVMYVCYLILSSMYNLKAIRTRLAWYFTIPFLVILAVAMGNQLLAWRGEDFFATRYFIVQVQVYGIVFGLLGVMVGRHTKQPNVWWQVRIRCRYAFPRPTHACACAWRTRTGVPCGFLLLTGVYATCESVHVLCCHVRKPFGLYRLCIRPL